MPNASPPAHAILWRQSLPSFGAAAFTAMHVTNQDTEWRWGAETHETTRFVATASDVIRRGPLK